MFASDLAAYARCTDHLDGTGIVATLEREIATITGFPYVLSMSSASTALTAAYDAMALVPGDEVIAPALAAAEAVGPLLRAGCTVVFADIEPDTLTLSPTAVERCLTPRTRAVVAVDVCGHPHDTAAIRDLADRHGIAYLADCAQGFGARRDSRATGYGADGCILSLNGQKDLAAGEGGLLLTAGRVRYERVLCAWQHPARQARELGPDRVNEFPQNGRINPLAAAAAVASLPAVLEGIERRRRRAREFIEALATSDIVEPLTIPDTCEPTYPYLIVAWRSNPRPVELLTWLHRAGFPCTLRDLPIQPLHPLAKRQYPHQVRIPAPLVHTAQVRRSCCLEVRWS